MRRLSLLGLGALFWSCAATAQVPLGFVGMNYGGDPTVAPGNNGYNTGVYPNFSRFDRVYDALANGGVTPHATWWSTLQPSNTTPTWTTLDAILSAEAAQHRAVEYTFSGVPSWVKGSQSLTTSGDRTNYTNFISAMFSHIAGDNQCFAFYSHWNEVNQPSIYWVSTAANLALATSLAYPIIKAACPHTVVLSPSITSGVDSGSSPNPDGPFQYLNDYLAAAPTAQDAINVHGYPMGYFSQTTDNTLRFQPENIINIITNARAVAAANSLSALPLYIDEGYGLADPASTSEPANTAAYAQAQAAQLLIAASEAVVSYANSFWGAGCLSPSTACGNEYVYAASAHLTKTGRAKRAVGAWLSGATFSTPIFRAQGANLITKAPNDGTVATGLLAGSGGAGCPSPPVGTASLPSTWALSATASVAGGMSYYVVGTGTSGGKAYLDLRICGTDTSGANSDLVRMDNFTASAAQGDDVVLASCLGVSAGDLTGVSETNLQINEYTSVPAYANEFMSLSAILPVSTASLGVASQCYQTRYTMKAATAAFAEPYIVVKHYQNVAIDVTLRVAAPHLDNGAVKWSGVITKTSGYSATLAWLANGTGTITAPSGTTDWRDIQGGVHLAGAGDSIPLTQSPILIENTLPTAYLPAQSAPGFVVSPTTPGASDSNPGTAARPFATLNKCNTAMVATPAQRICYIRGVVSTTSFHVSLGTWTIYPGDPAGSAIINLSASRSGANAANGIGSTAGATIKNLVFNGTATDGNGMFEFDSSSINFWGNTVTLSGAEQALVLFNPQNTKVQGGAFTAPGNNSTNMMSVISTDGITQQNVVLSDFTTVGSDRFVVEWIFTSSAAMRNSHLDRITASGFHGTTGFGCISWVGSTLAGSTGNTAYGNTCTNTAANTELLVGMEVSVANTTFQANTINYLPFATSISQIPGGAILNNVIVMSTIFTPGGQGAFTQGGTYAPSSEWIGTNTITGSVGTNAVVGCVAGTTGYCTLGHGAYGAQPTLYSQSPVYTP